MSAKKDKNTKTLNGNIPSKEVMMTRTKSARMRQKQSSSSDVGKDCKIQDKSPEDKLKTTNNKKRKIEERDRTPEFIPVKRKMTSNKVILKPKSDLKTVVTLNEYKKRKPVSPKKMVFENVVEDMSMDIKSKIDDSVTAPSTNDQTCTKTPDDDDEYNSLTFSDIIENTEDLTEDDMMEIVTCPSPVWWEEAPNNTYNEDPVSIGGSTGPQGSAKELENFSGTAKTSQLNPNVSSVLTPTNPEPNTKSNKSQPERSEQDISECSRKRGRTLLKKRSTLQDILDKLNKATNDSVKCDIGNVKKNKTPNIDEPKKVKRIKSRDILPQVPLDVLKDLENFEIPTAKSAKNNLIEVKECIVIDDEEDDLDRNIHISDFASVELHERSDEEKRKTETDNTNQVMNGSRIVIPNIISNTKNEHATLTKNTDSQNFIKCTIEKNTESTTPKDISNLDIEKHKNNKIIIKKNVIIKPQSLINIPHTGVINNVQSSRGKIFFPFNKFFYNNVKNNAEKADVPDSPMITIMKSRDGKTKIISKYIDEQNNHKKVQNENEDSSHNIITSTQSNELSTANVMNTSLEHVVGSQDTNPMHIDSDMKISKEVTNKMIKEAYLKFSNHNNDVNKTDNNSNFTKDKIMPHDDSDLNLSDLSQNNAKRVLKIDEISKVHNNDLKKDKCVTVSRGDKKIILLKPNRRNNTNLMANNIETIEINGDEKIDDKLKLSRSIQISENGEMNAEENENFKNFVRQRLEQIMGSRGLVSVKLNSEEKNQTILSKRLEETLDIPFKEGEENKYNNILRRLLEQDITKSTFVQENFYVKEYNTVLKNVEGKTENASTNIEKPIVKTVVPNTVNLDMENKKLNINHNQVSDRKVLMATNISDRGIVVEKINGADIERKLPDSISIHTDSKMKILKHCATISTLENDSFSGNVSKLNTSGSWQSMTVCKVCCSKHKSIAVMHTSTVKYCLKCSSIFESENCNYCTMGGEKISFPNPSSCHLCKYMCCCLKNLITHLRSHVNEMEQSPE